MVRTFKRDLSVTVEIGDVDDGEEFVVCKHLTQSHHELVHVTCRDDAIAVRIDKSDVIEEEHVQGK